jgi:hypothetical protein
MFAPKLAPPQSGAKRFLQPTIAKTLARPLAHQALIPLWDFSKVSVFPSGPIAQARQISSSGRPATAGPAPDVVHRAIHATGQPLDAPSRGFFEPRFGRSFSEVRVHTNADAAGSANAVNALAYTVGRDIVFAGRQYRPEIPEGKALLAHELTHVVQQAGMAGRAASLIQRQPQPTPQVTQQLYDQALASMATKPGVNPILLTILKQGRVNQAVKSVHSAASTMQVSIPAAPGSPPAAPVSTPAVKILFDLEISSNAAQLPAGAFADFVDDPKTQLSFVGQVVTGKSITRLLKIVTKAPPAGVSVDLLAEALVHEGTHMLLAIDNLLNSVNAPGLSTGLTGAQTAFDKYLKAAASSPLRGALVTSLVGEVNRVFTPPGANAPTISAADANDAVASVLAHLLEERFAVDQQAAAYPRTVSNMTMAGAYLWDLLAEEASKPSWPKPPGSGAQTLVAAAAAFLDNVAAQLKAPPAPPATTTPAATGSGAPQKVP